MSPLRESDLSFTQHLILQTVRDLGGKGIVASDITQAIAIRCGIPPKQSTVSSSLKDLASRGWFVRHDTGQIKGRGTVGSYSLAEGVSGGDRAVMAADNLLAAAVLIHENAEQLPASAGGAFVVSSLALEELEEQIENYREARS